MTNNVEAEWEKTMEEIEEGAPFKQAISDMIKNCNSMGLDEKNVAREMLEAFRGQHRTLQATFIRVLREFITEVGKTPLIHTDARNEGAIQWCKEASEAEGHIPFI